MVPVDPFAASASHSLSRIVGPGGLREWASAEVLTMNFSGVAGQVIPLFSSTGATAGSDDEYGAYKAKIPEDYSLYLCGVSQVNASTGDGDGRNLTLELHTSALTVSSCFYIVTAHAAGAFAMSSEIPIQIDAKGASQGMNVYAKVITNLATGGGAGLGVSNSNNWASFNYILVENK